MRCNHCHAIVKRWWIGWKHEDIVCFEWIAKRAVPELASDR